MSTKFFPHMGMACNKINQSIMSTKFFPHIYNRWESKDYGQQ